MLSIENRKYTIDEFFDVKVTRYIGSFLKENGVLDKRDQEGYESWDENVKVIEEYVGKSEDSIAL